MARVRKTEAEARQARAAAELAAKCKPRGKAAKSGSRRARASKGRIARVLAQVERRIEAEDWNGATPEDLVGLYAVLHAGVYGVSPIEEVAPVWLAAVSAAKRLTLEAFDGSPRLAVEFLRWIWGREIEREQWRQKHTGGRGKRLTWRHVFLWRESLVEWRIEEQRRNGPK